MDLENIVKVEEQISNSMNEISELLKDQRNTMEAFNKEMNNCAIQAVRNKLTRE